MEWARVKEKGGHIAATAPPPVMDRRLCSPDLCEELVDHAVQHLNLFRHVGSGHEHGAGRIAGLFSPAIQLRHTLACQMTSGDLVDRLIVMLIHRWVQRWEVDGVVLPMMRIHRHRATHLEIRISTLEVSIISLEWIETMRSWFC